MGADDREVGAAAQFSRGSRSRLIFAAALLLLAAVFTALGSWQVKRLFWKLDLIARVEARMSARPVDAPGTVTAKDDEYRRVAVAGVFRHDKEVQVQAVTTLGAGFWVMTPLIRSDGTAILVNRGFVPRERRDPATRISGAEGGPVHITGLIRMPEPGGAFLRKNDPTNDRWYARDVAAIAAAKGIPAVAPYFIDADATPNPGGWPVGGLTITRFPNSHLVYAVTWYAMSVMSLWAAYSVHRRMFA